MSFLINPSFEGKDDHWARINLANATTLDFDPVHGVSAKSGSVFLTLRSSVPSGSVGQDVVTPQGLTSISAFAWVRAGLDGPVSGTLAIWQLDTDPDRAMPAPFIAGNEWTLVTSTLDFPNPAASKTIRIEIYVNEANKGLLIDSVNAF
ncbi:hypothetical protein [Streptomyces glomeratus]|uniref:Uncharacterized protein n=1 Tax=Streptomyces glomeratus TaxID=284452 RepID=A0ABP6L176_9ACTN|nr:hypothetical protein [Streptomyces glomeratus]MCF1511701.1 hypothetical protein [Streptomyces glomeratus]